MTDIKNGSIDGFLPDGWEIKKLSEVCEKITDGSHNPPKGVDSSNFFMLSSKNIFDDLINFENPRYLNQKDFESENKRTEVKYNDVLMTIVGTIGRVAVVNKNHPKFTLQRSVAVLKVKKNIIEPRFLMFGLQNILEFLCNESRGVAQKGLYLNQIRQIEIQLPSLTEQKIIVSILDEAFRDIDKAKANAEQNLKNAKELFESFLQQIFEAKGDDWKEKKLGDVTIKIGSGATPRGGKESYKEEGISLVRSMNVHDRYFKDINLAFIDEKQAKELNNVTLQEYDVLLNITGASVTRCCIIPTKYLPARVNQHVSIIRPKKEIINSNFLNLLLTSKFYKDQLVLTGEQGATRQAITKVQLENFIIHFPKSLTEQKTIVQKLDALSAETKKLEAIYQKKIADLEELKKSILQKAFTGQLKPKKEVVTV